LSRTLAVNENWGRLFVCGVQLRGVLLALSRMVLSTPSGRSVGYPYRGWGGQRGLPPTLLTCSVATPITWRLGSLRGLQTGALRCRGVPIICCASVILQALRALRAWARYWGRGMSINYTLSSSIIGGTANGRAAIPSRAREARVSGTIQNRGVNIRSCLLTQPVLQP
jgi:hypothetical protein